VKAAFHWQYNLISLAVAAVAVPDTIWLLGRDRVRAPYNSIERGGVFPSL
jgi:hypothetical protein